MKIGDCRLTIEGPKRRQGAWHRFEAATKDWVGLRGVEVGIQLLARHEARGLPEDGMQCADIELAVTRDGQGLAFPGGGHSLEFDMAAALGVDVEAEPTEDCDDLIA